MRRWPTRLNDILEHCHLRMTRILILWFQLLIWIRAESYHRVLVSERVAGDEGTLWATPGSTVHLKCLSEDTTALLKWYHDGQLLTTATHVTITTSLDIVNGRQTSLLSRNSVGSHETGRYECWDIRANRLEGFLTVQLATTPSGERVRVQIIEPSSDSALVRFGSTLDLRCTGSPSSRLVWFRNNDPLTQASQTDHALTIQTALDHRRPNTMTSLLRVTRVTAAHAGVYSCRDLLDPSDRDDVIVSVENGRPVTRGYHGGLGSGVVVMDASVVALRMSSELNLDCSFDAETEKSGAAAEGGRSVSIDQQWSKDGQLLTGSDDAPTAKYLIRRNTTTLTTNLRVRNTDRSDAGIYRCTFRRTNSGEAIAIVQFNVTTLPCPPIDPPVKGRLDICPLPPVFGDTCSFICCHGYRLTDPRPVRCERHPDGHTYWTRPTPNCIATTLRSDILSGSSSLGGVVIDLPSTVSHVLLRVRQSLVLECSGKTTWSRRGVVLENSAKYSVDNTSLTIRNADRSDVGIYDCTVVKETVAGNFRFNVTTLPCPPFPAFYGTIDWCPVSSSSSGSVYGDICVFRCPSGSRLVGSQLRSCELHGTTNLPYWTGHPAYCTVSAESQIASARSADIPIHAETSTYISICVLVAATASAFTHH